MSKRILAACAVLALSTSLTVAFAAESAKETTVQGWIADSYCGKKNANAAGKDCTIACAKSGAKLVLVAGDKTYVLSDQKLALDNVGHEVAVTGVVDNDAIKVTKIQAVKKTS